MKVFVYEHVCGGGWPQGRLPHSLAVEGGAMLCALGEDLARLPDVEVTTLLDARCRLTMPAGVRATRVMSAGQAYEELFDQALQADAVFIIAPELENTLARQVRDLREAGANVIAPPDGWLEMCSNKRLLSIPGVPMIPTFPLEQDEPHRISTDHAVLKPAFGAGSQTISVVPTADLERLRRVAGVGATPGAKPRGEWTTNNDEHQPRDPAAAGASLRSSPGHPPVKALIVQPYIVGTAVSMGAIATGDQVDLSENRVAGVGATPGAKPRGEWTPDAHEHQPRDPATAGASLRSSPGHPPHGGLTILPPARQLLSDDGYLRYEGGVVPWDTPAAEAMQQIVRRCFDVLEGLQGYIGFDFVLPEETPDQPLLVEINPRLCTSYLGYRRLTDDNLASLMLPWWPKQPVTWQDRTVRFQPDGTFHGEHARMIAGDNGC
jgi:tyramine---L-glutamate ligase